MSDISQAIRSLAGQLRPPTHQPLSLMQGVVISIENQAECTVICQGGAVAVDGWRWLWDAYMPFVGDVVWIIDGGPGQRFILGITNGNALRARGMAPIHGEVNGGMRHLGTWAFNPISNGSYPTYTQSPGGAAVTQADYYVYMHAGLYQFTTRVLAGPNLGNMNLLVNDVLIGAHAGYSAAYAATLVYHAATHTQKENGYVKLSAVKNLKHINSTEYFVCLMSIAFGRYDVAP